jgi:hypothetical protein
MKEPSKLQRNVLEVRQLGVVYTNLRHILHDIDRYICDWSDR